MTEFLHRVEGLSGSVPVRPAGVEPPAPRAQTHETSFAQVLEQEVRKVEEVRFSLHALERLRLRNIQLTQREVQALGSAVNRVAEKGGRDLLVVMDGVAFVVNVPSRTVITAIDQAHLRGSVFTQIDSAVIA